MKLGECIKYTFKLGVVNHFTRKFNFRVKLISKRNAAISGVLTKNFVLLFGSF